VLNSFTDSAGAESFPTSSLILDGSGNLYGTTSSFDSSSDGGTVFSVRTDGTGSHRLHTFARGPNDALYPGAALILDRQGNLYGTTVYGGASGAGTVFTVRTDGTAFRVLHSFGSEESDGQNPVASLFLDGSGTLFGTTPGGGAGTFGTVFALSIGRHHPVVTPGPFVPVQKR
jgi:uncharacterized repeat protein (TIGR03803 family)